MRRTSTFLSCAFREHILILYTSRSEEWPRLPSLRASNDINVPSKLARYLSGMGADDLLLRASNEGLLRPRVARAREIIRLHPLFAS